MHHLMSQFRHDLKCCCLTLCYSPASVPASLASAALALFNVFKTEKEAMEKMLNMPAPLQDCCICIVYGGVSSYRRRSQETECPAPSCHAWCKMLTLAVNGNDGASAETLKFTVVRALRQVYDDHVAQC